MQQITNFLMFTGQAEEAMNFYVSLFPDSAVGDVKKYGPNQGGKEGTIMHAKFSLNGQPFMCIDSPPVHAFTFTASLSLYIDCDSDAEIEKLYKELSDGGNIMMPLGAYPFSKKYGWVGDRFGVSWQLNFNQ